MAEKEAHPTTIPLTINRGLTDKLVEKRKAAALELERMVKELVGRSDFPRIKEIIRCLKDEYTLSSNPNSRKGGLVGLAAIAIALGRPCIGMNLPELVQPVLVCFEDQDPRVRYYACESLYNISKVARGAVLVFFNNIFEGLCKLTCDSDSNVRYGAELLDRLMKEVVSENPHFEVDNFILLLRDRMYTRNGYVRQFLVSWILFLDSVPEIHMHEHVPEFIDGLFMILGDKSNPIKKSTEDALGELLKEINQHCHSVRFEAMANIVAQHCQSEDKIIQRIALTWMQVFLELAGRTLMRFTPNILIAVLPCMAYKSDKESIRKVAVKVNHLLKNLIRSSDDDDTVTDGDDQSHIDLAATVPTNEEETAQSSTATPPPTTVTDDGEKKRGEEEGGEASAETSSPVRQGRERSQAIDSSQEPIRLYLLPVIGVLLAHTKFTAQETRLETLQWLLWLHKRLPKRVYNQAPKLFPDLLQMLTDDCNEVVDLVLQMFASLSTSIAGPELEPSLVTPLQPTPRSSSSPPSALKPLRSYSSVSGKTTSTAPGKANSSKPMTGGGKGSTEGEKEEKRVVSLNKYFHMFLVEVLRMFSSDRILLLQKGSMIIRHMCTYVNARAVYCALAEILTTSTEKHGYVFSSLMVRELNIILFSAAELFELRQQLQAMDGQESWSLFKTLYQCWCHNPVATVALCLLSQNYSHAANLVTRFGEVEITAEVLCEIDRLVQLIESPIFAYLRLQLLTPHHYPQLVQTLYGLLMLLPQTEAFENLKQRLSCVSIINVIPHDTKKRNVRPTPKDVDFDQLLQHFVSTQQKHFATRQKQILHDIRKELVTS